MDKIRTLIVDDDVIWLNNIKVYLHTEDDIILEATATDRESAVRTAILIHPDVIVMDTNLSGNNYDGIYAAAEISREINTKIIMLTSHQEEDVVLNSFTAGAINILPKDDWRSVVDAINSAKTENSPYEVLLKEYSRLKQEEQLKPLSDSEREVFRLLENGYSRSRIQNELYKSENTIKTQIKSILKKMGVSNVGLAVKKVHQNGLI